MDDSVGEFHPLSHAPILLISDSNEILVLIRYILVLVALHQRIPIRSSDTFGAGQSI